MFNHTSRRQFLSAGVGGGALAAVADLSFLGDLPTVSAAEAQLDPKIVRFGPDIEPLVRLLEDTPRERLLEEVATRIKGGVSYREVLAALLLAGVRNVQPRPAVGFKFHAVLVVNSAHLASLSSPDELRWLPIFWALDYFKACQAADVKENDWTMAPVNEAAVPPAHKARQAFTDAMDRWDEQAADAAVAGLARSAGANEMFEIFARYGARDFRSIGHKAIFVANSWRTLSCIGWQYSEPVLRSLAYALLNREGDGPPDTDTPAERPWKRNVELARQIRSEWQEGKPEDSATVEMLATLRTASDEDATRKVVELLNRGVAPQSIWDALLVGAGELLARAPGIVALHAVTSSNALRFAYEASSVDDTRRMLLLQNAAFVTLFRDAVKRRGGQLADVSLDTLEPMSPQSGDAGVEEIFADIGGDRLQAAKKTMAYARQHPDPERFMNVARTLVFLKGKDTHDYKFCSAVLEDYYHVSPTWRDRYLASSVFNLRGSQVADNPLAERTRAALRA
ncbi:MAG: hypothetical protein HYX69_13245 [Planctomycetia bacterium]|nr:hypothetical protein [Planctomycetia bacterium]